MDKETNSGSAFKTARAMGTLLCERGFQARFAGGCVRDRLMGISPKDYDIATSAQPEDVTALFRANGIKVVPTGLAHGTVTAVQNGIPVEITTLRRDVECHGRRAVVAFTDSFEEDAQRRDFTINALYRDMDGNLYDYVGGQDDLEQHRLQFVGSPRARIVEDSLRILRYFRFLSRFNWDFSPEYEVPFRDLASNLENLSKERIKMEFDEILLRDSGVILEKMNLIGLFPHLFLNADPCGKSFLNMFEGFPKELDQPGYRWFVFFNHLFPSQVDLERAAQQARLSKKETALLSALKDIVQRLKNGLSAIPECLLLIKRGLSQGTSLFLFLTWFMKKNFFLVPDCTVKVLKSVDTVRFPSINKKIRSIHPPEARKQMAFLFQISCYLELHLDLESMDVQSLKNMLKESGFDSERELYGFPLKNPHN